MLHLLAAVGALEFASAVHDLMHTALADLQSCGIEASALKSADDVAFGATLECAGGCGCSHCAEDGMSDEQCMSEKHTDSNEEWPPR